MRTNRFKFETIVVATDLSEAGSVALHYAQAIARLHESTLVVVHAIDPVGYAFPDGAPEFAAADHDAREELRRIEEETRCQGIPVHSVVETGMICERILQTVADHQGDLLVLGTRAKTAVGRAALGTVARQLIAKAQCPILTVSAAAETQIAWAGLWRRVLVATDFSEASLSALGYAHSIAQTQLVALHVPLYADAYENECCIERLRFLAPLNETHSVPVEHIVMPGDVASLVAQNAHDFSADLVVLGSPEHELAEEDVQSSTVLQVISRVTCPVLCVPATNKVEGAIEAAHEACYRG